MVLSREKINQYAVRIIMQLMLLLIAFKSVFVGGRFLYGLFVCQKKVKETEIFSKR